MGQIPTLATQVCSGTWRANLYGTTGAGGDLACRFVPAALVSSGFPGCGVVFKLDTTSKETVLHRFHWGSGRGRPRDRIGPGRPRATLYGTTFGGGDLACGGGSGCGVVFKLDTTGKENRVTTSSLGERTGQPLRQPQDWSGTLQATCTAPPSPAATGASAGAESSSSWVRPAKRPYCTRFTGGADGAGPEAGLVRDNAGNLYGTTDSGGRLDMRRPAAGCGVVFKLGYDRQGNRAAHVSLAGRTAHSPAGRLIQDSAGNLYGTRPPIQRCFFSPGWSSSSPLN